MPHRFRRALVVLAFASPLAFVPGTAHADLCTVSTESPLPERTVRFPCPGPQDVVVAPPVWHVTCGGIDDPWLNYIVLRNGGRLLYTNDCFGPWRIYGAGFDSGWVGVGMTVDVSGVSSLGVGTYTVYEANGQPASTLYVRSF